MDKSFDTFEQNKRLLSASFVISKSILFVNSQHPLYPFSMLQYPPWTLWPGYNIEKGRGGQNVKIRHWKTRGFNETGLFRGVSQTAFVHDCSFGSFLKSVWIGARGEAYSWPIDKNVTKKNEGGSMYLPGVSVLIWNNLNH